MDHYIDIQIFPNPEIETAILMNKLFYQLHLVFVDRNSDVAVSFPGYLTQIEGFKSTLGSVLRLHGSRASLAALNLADGISALSDYVVITKIAPVPQEIDGHATFVRKHTKGQKDVERKRQFLLKKAGGQWNEIAQESLTKFVNKLHCNLPFIHMISHSSEPAEGEEKNHFCLFINKQKCLPVKGKLTKYGLSDPKQKTSVPIF